MKNAKTGLIIDSIGSINSINAIDMNYSLK